MFMGGSETIEMREEFWGSGCCVKVGRKFWLAV